MKIEIKEICYDSASQAGVIYSVITEKRFWYTKHTKVEKHYVLLEKSIEDAESTRFKNYAVDIKTGKFFPDFSTSFHLAKLIIHDLTKDQYFLTKNHQPPTEKNDEK